ncbi:unnamed protein product [Rhodiola kirilowii]
MNFPHCFSKFSLCRLHVVWYNCSYVFCLQKQVWVQKPGSGT